MKKKTTKTPRPQNKLAQVRYQAQRVLLMSVAKGMTVTEAAAYLGVSRPRIHQLAKRFGVTKFKKSSRDTSTLKFEIDVR